jgi:hypothetical protein
VKEVQEQEQLDMETGETKWPELEERESGSRM